MCTLLHVYKMPPPFFYFKITFEFLLVIVISQDHEFDFRGQGTNLLFYLAVNLSASLLKQYFEKRYEHMFNRIVSRGLVQRCFLLICRLVNVIITWEFPSGYFVHYLNVLKVARCVKCLINEVQSIPVIGLSLKQIQ